MRNQADCGRLDSLPPKYRELINSLLNSLRQMVAAGGTYKGKTFEPQLMNGLIYDCKFEVEAQQLLKGEIQEPKPDHYNVTLDMEDGNMVSIKQRLLKAVKSVFDSQKDKLRNMINAKATRFGCWSNLFARRNPKLVCVYDRKNEIGKSYGRGYCEEDKQCKLVGTQTCWWGLCYDVEH
ncbi:unnamed protein product [Strongylus vulgaris]|uniref:SCP domain-containing protein n=1 Tax=Strongylus vulgaris TaxID=40348 RepID=A0A3P7JT29_STRVU|nr:unnamed protein product [Strongylus vulgaris]